MLVLMEGLILPNKPRAPHDIGCFGIHIQAP